MRLQRDRTIRSQMDYYSGSGAQAAFYLAHSLNGVQSYGTINCEYTFPIHNGNVPFSLSPLTDQHDVLHGNPVPTTSRDLSACTHTAAMATHPPYATLASPPSPSPPFAFPPLHYSSQCSSPEIDDPTMRSYPLHLQQVIIQLCRLPPDQQELLLKPIGHPQNFQKQDPVVLQAAIDLIVQCRATGGQFIVSDEAERALMLRVQRPPSETGPGSRQGCMHWRCLWPGCEKTTKRKPNATRHLLSHTGAKPEVCAMW